MARFLIVSLFLGLVSSSIFAEEPVYSVTHLKQLVTDTVTANVDCAQDEEISVNIIQFDENTAIPTCGSPIRTSLSKPKFSEQSNVVILSCDSPSNWNIFVPVTIKVLTPVLVANRTISPGELLSPDDLVFEKRDKNQLSDGFFKHEDEILGLSPLRVISAGMPFTRRNLKQVAIIKKNQTIKLAVVDGAVEVTMLGIAKTDGFLNQTIKVMNPTSKRVVDAIVKGRDRAEIIY